MSSSWSIPSSSSGILALAKTQLSQRADEVDAERVTAEIAAAERAAAERAATEIVAVERVAAERAIAEDMGEYVKVSFI